MDTKRETILEVIRDGITNESDVDSTYYDLAKGALVALEKEGYIITKKPDPLKREQPSEQGDVHPEDFCDKCGGPNISWFAQNELWNKVTADRHGIICPICFVKEAEEQGIDYTWEVSPEIVNSQSEGDVGRDEARLALFRAIEAIKIGNKTDDKLLLEELRKAGYWITRLQASTTPPQEPVAWMIEDFRSPARFSTDPRTPVMAASRPDHLCTPLYLAPPANASEQEPAAKPTHEQWWGWIADVLKAEADRQQWHQGMYPQIADEISESRQALYRAAKACRFNAEKPRAPLVEPAFAPPANDEAVRLLEWLHENGHDLSSETSENDPSDYRYAVLSHHMSSWGKPTHRFEGVGRTPLEALRDAYDATHNAQEGKDNE